jgi:hypothetical protein
LIFFTVRQFIFGLCAICEVAIKFDRDLLLRKNYVKIIPVPQFNIMQEFRPWVPEDGIKKLWEFWRSHAVMARQCPLCAVSDLNGASRRMTRSAIHVFRCNAEKQLAFSPSPTNHPLALRCRRVGAVHRIIRVVAISRQRCQLPVVAPRASSTG